MLVLLVLRVPIAVAMMLAGGSGYVVLSGVDPLLSYLKSAAFARYSNYDLSVVPMFLLMGNLASRGGLSASMFRAANALIGHFRGGIAMAAVVASAGFGAICGSSLATAATMGEVALPELRKSRYDPGLAAGALAAGGTLGILIPPSIVLAIYAILTEQNIAKLFTAAFVPGVIATLGYMAVIGILVRVNPRLGPAGERMSWTRRLHALADVWPVVLIFVVMLGGMYGGVFSATEGAAIGTGATLVLAFVRGMRWAGLRASILGAARATGMIFLILLGADVLNAFLALSQLPVELATWVQGSGLAPLAIVTAVVVLYVILGCVMDSLSMILLTIPIFFPMIMGLDLWGLGPAEKAIWFGVLSLMVVEIGLITPPVGMNVYIISSISRDVPMGVAFRGVAPFLVSDLVRVVLLIAFPALSLALVRLMG
ncbi:MAG: TRAP transporter large permease subunit [Betaproteobacteria bacterium]|nr:TRAP transporter large permease subunit [Betaproteobacteria bacterium]